jgi:DNA-binding NarL/FixJ family response regulator
MQRPFVLLATTDSAFESTAIDAILKTHHGVRPTHDLDEAYRALCGGDREIALAVVDTGHQQFGRDLVQALNGANASFPVLAMTDGDDPMDLEDCQGLAITRLDKKSMDAARLREEIRRQCVGATSCLC